MKLRRIIAALLACVLLISDSPLMLMDLVWAVDETPQTISATDDRLLLSATVGSKNENGADVLYCAKQDYVRADLPTIKTLRSAAIGEFNASGSEWNWFAYKVSVPTAGTYTLGVKVNGCKWSSYAIPLCVNNEAYTLSYTAKSQQQTAEVTLPAGEHVVVMFMPMPKDAADVENNVYNDYPWCNVGSMAVDAALTVMAAPTAAEVEACFSTTVSAVDKNYVLPSAAVWQTSGDFLEFNQRDAVKADLPYIDTLRSDAIGEFNKEGEEWGWFAYKINVPADGTYTLGVGINNCRNAPYKIPLCVNNEVYTLAYAATGAQSATVTVTLPAGEHVVVMFMPMPQNTESDDGQAWVDYPWCNVQSMIVDSALTVMAAPTEGEVESCFGRVISAVDETVVLTNKRKTSVTNQLSFEDSGYSAIRADLPSVESLPFSGNLIDQWPFASVKVTAFKDGDYDITVDANVKANGTSLQLGMLVDGKAYSVSFTKPASDSATVKIDTTVELKKGDHVITFFIPMPADHSTTVSNIWNQYPWINYNTIEFGPGITAVSKPTIEEIKAPLCATFSAIDDSVILWSVAAGDNGNGFLEFNQRDAVKADLPYIDSLYSDAFGEFNDPGNEWGWFAYKLSVPAEGTYTLGVKTQNCRNAPYKIPLWVNGAVYVLNYETTGAVRSTVDVTLPAGEHVVVMFMPMPQNEESDTEQAWVDYPWCNVESMVVDTQLTVIKPTVIEVENCFYTTVNVGDETLFLANKFTDSGDILKDAVADEIRSDQPTVAGLPYAANMLGNWPFASMKVTAPADGTYSILVNANVKANGTSLQLGMLVDGEAHSLPFAKPASDSATVKIDATVELTKGDHVITFFMPLPVNHSVTVSNVWNDYPWINYNTILLSKSLTVSKPTLDEITAALLGVTYHAGDENYVQSNLYEDKGNTLGGYTGSYNDIRWSKYYIEGLNMSQLPRIPYAAIEVTAAEDGTYTILVEAAANESAQSKQIALLVDGVPQTVPIADSATPTLSAEVTLTKGTHLLIFTSPMPVDAETAAAAGTGDSSAYPWFDFKRFYFEKGLTASGDMSADSKTVTVEQSETVSKNWSNYKDSDGDGVSDYLSAIMDDMRVHRYSIEKLLENGLTRVPHISFTVSATEDGWYDVYASVMANSSLTSKYAAMIVDGETVYKIAVAASGEKQLIGAHIPLTAGNHTIVITAAMPETDAEAQAITDPDEDGWAAMNKAYPWFDFYSVTVSGRLSVISGEKNPLKDQSVLFVGDSITHSKNSWASKIGTWNNMAWTNAGISGATISDMRGLIIRHELMANAGNEYDYVIMHGGINDAEAQVGEVSDSWNVADFDTNTYAGALETMFYYAYENFGTAKLGYIVNYATPNADESKWKGTADMSAHFEMGKKVCEKWGVAYIDLYFGSTSDGESYSYDILQVDQVAENFLNSDPHEIHLSDEGYRVICPYIEAWMKTLTVKESPIPQANSGKLVDAGDETKVLSGSFTVKDGTLQDRVYTGMVEDEASIELLPYAQELLGDWPFASVKVNAEEAGDYRIKVEVAAKNTASMGMLVDGEVYTLSYSKQNGYFEYLEQTVHLEAGSHYITFTAAMPETAVDTVGNAWDVYPWSNIASIMVDEGLEVTEKPTLEEVTAKLRTLSDKGDTVIAAGDENKVLAKDFTDKGDTLGDAVTGDLRWDSLALEQVTCDSLERMPYFALQVTAAEDGYYDILLDISTNKNTVSDQLGLLVDGKDLQILPFDVAENAKVKATVYLEKGTHTLTFTTPMPETAEEFQDYLKQYNETHEEKLEQGNGITHPWMDVRSITLSKGLKAEAKPETLQIENPFYNRVEAEDGGYVIYNNYNTPNESNAAASGGMVVGGAWNSIYQQTFEELKVWLDAKHNAYVEYAVVAPADGEYEIRVGFLAGSNDKSVAKPYIAVVVNGTTYQAQFTKNWNQVDKVKLTVSLKEGLNIIRCTSITTDQAVYGVKGWINHDFLDLDLRLTAVKHSAVSVEAEDSQHVNKVKVQDGADYEKASGKVLGGTDRKYVSGLKLTLDQLTVDRLKQIPYVSFTVTAPQNGYYPISVNMSGDGRLSASTIGVLVDGQVNVAHYARTDKTTAGARVDALVYLTKGDHVITFTTPIPADATVEANYSYYWCNFDSVTLYDGLALAQIQLAPTAQPDYVRVEVEDHAMFNQNQNNGTAAGNAYYRSSQTVAEMLANGIDGTKTPYAELTVHAAKAGTYTLYLGVTAGMTQGCMLDEIAAKFVIDVNGKPEAQTIQVSKSTYSTVIQVQLTLNAGTNTVRLTHLGKDSQCGGTTWIDFDYIEMTLDVSQQLKFATTGEKLEAENNSYAGYSEFANSSYSGGLYLGDPNYDDVDESDITFEKLDPADIGELPYVTYRVFAEKAGTYTVTVGFAAGMHHYTSAEIAAGATGGFAVIVNGVTKQLIEYDIASTNSKMSRLITLELQEGENEITFTTALAEYIIDRMPRNDETYRLIWVDHDYLILSEGLSAMSNEVEDYDIEDSDFDHAQITVKTPADDDGDTDETLPTDGPGTGGDTAGGEPGVLMLIWILVAAAVVCILIIIILSKKRKKQ